MKKLMLLPVVLLAILLTVSAVACSSQPQEVITYCAAGCQTSWLGNGMCENACNNAACSYDNGDCATPTAAPHGSVTYTDSTWIAGQYLDDYQKLDITDTIQNTGGDGTITVKVTVSPSSTSGSDNRISGATEKSTSIYLKQGEQMTLHFYFFGHGTLSWVTSFPGQ